MILAAVMALCAAAAVLSVLTRAAKMPRQGLASWCTPAAWALNVAAAVLAVVAGAVGLGGHGAVLRLGDLGGLGAAALRVDRLSALFLVISFAVAVPVLLAAVTRRAGDRPRLPAAVALVLAAVLIVLTADHLFVLLFGWETLTVAFYLLAGFDRDRPGRARASVAAATFGKVSGAALLAGGLLLGAHAGDFTLADLATASHGTVGQVAYGLLLLGFGVKVGLLPVQVWLPPAYTAAPGPARAVMAGVAVNVGFYGMWRTLQVLGPAPIWLATTVLVVAGVTAILGISHAAVSPDLAALVAWSSVENAGVITAGFGAALVGSAAHNQPLVAAGMLAATAQVIAHALGKSLLFTATAAVEDSTGTTDLDALRGVARHLPFAGTGLVIGSLTLAGLPLTAGFASEWLTLESLMQQFRLSSLPMQLASATAAALVALTVGVAGVTFVRLIGLTAFGAPSAVSRRVGIDDTPGHRAATILLSAGCLGAAMFAPLEVELIAAGLEPVVGSATRHALASPWVLQPVFADFSALSPTWLWICIPALTVLTGGVAVLFSGSRSWRVRRVPAWSSASPGVDRGVGYTSFSYANPMRKVLANLLLTSGQLHHARQERAPAAAVSVETHGDSRALGPASAPSPLTAVDAASRGGTGLQYRVDVVEVVETYLYRPLELALLALVRTVKRLQSGRLDAYLTYMLIALLAVLAVVTATAQRIT